MWGVYIRKFDGYEHQWRFQCGPFKTKKDAEAMRVKLSIDHLTAEFMVKKI